jgi:peptidoglycan hydrolase-like protein with peptidoglycan-binding domain
LLKQVGLDPGPADGIAGAKTRAVIAQFQSSKMNLIETTGRLDESTYTALKNAVSENWKYSAAQLKPPQQPAPKADTGELPARVSVSVTRASLHDTPGSEGKVLATLREGAKLLVQGEDKDCYFVIAEDGKQGWIYKSMTKK